MPTTDRPPGCLATLEVIAGAIRRELGEAIDSYPGCRSPEGADPINRGFRAVARSLVVLDLTPAADPTPLVSRALLMLARRRLAAEGRDDLRVKVLIEEEPGGPDDWTAFLILSSRTKIEPLLNPDDA
jgi:hypothetical protein